MEPTDESNVGAASSRRIKRLPEQWRALIEAHASSGLGVEAYCRQQQITPSCFYRWRRFFAGAAGGTSPWANPKRRRAIDGFAAVRVAVPASGPGSCESMCLRLGGGRELILPVSLPIQRLAELLMALESKPRGPEREV